MKTRFLNVAADVSRAHYDLELFLTRGEFALYENQRSFRIITPASALAEVSYGKLIFSCWGEGWARSWRVIAYAASTENFALECVKQMGRVRCLVELRRSASVAETESRHEFCERLAALIKAHVSGLEVLQAVTARDDSHHFSGVYTRLLLKERNRILAGIGVSAREPQSEIDGAISAGLIWHDHLQRQQSAGRRLLIFAPRGKSTTLAARLTALNTDRIDASLYEVDEANALLAPLTPFDQGDLMDSLRRSARRAVWARELEPDSELAEAMEAICALAPQAIEAQHQGSAIRFSIRGLEFAHLSVKQRRVDFGIGQGRIRLTEETRPQLGQLVAQIISERTTPSPAPNGMMYRAQAERWLESVIRRQVNLLDPTFDARYAYSQVPAYRGEQRGFIDLLTVTRDGRLAVIELKVAEDVEFAFQGLDYWLRVEWHRKRGDFQRRGYFPNVKLTDETPLLCLVAPLFRFHAATKLIAGCISPRVPFYRIGINDDWRAGVKVLLTERLSCP